MRIVAGKWRGRPLAAPPGDATRPTADRTREALFSMLVSRLGSFEGLRVADVFAGTGALGLEALSRGAAHASFVEHDRTALAAIKANIVKLGAGSETSLHAARVESVARADAPHELLMLDPPYGSGLAPTALARLHEQGWIAPLALVSVEVAKGETLSIPGYNVEVDRSYGKAHLLLLRAPGS